MLRYFLYQVKINKVEGASWMQLKHFFKWKNSLTNNASSVKDEQPWMTYDAIDFLKNEINNESRVFEFGGGGSTLFFVKRGKEVVTVEHDEKWFTALSQILKSKNIQNWNGNFVQRQSGNMVNDPDPSNPDHYASNDEQSKGFHFYNYAAAIDKYQNDYFDVVIVDGRSRPSCMKHAIPKIKTEGILVLDNSDRDYYLPYFKKILLNQFEVVLERTGPSPYSRQFTKTSVWRKK